MKKKLLSIILIVFVSCIFFIGCDCVGKQPSPSPSPEATASVGLNVSKKDLTLGDNLYLVARADGTTDNKAFTWRSSNEAVATVDEEGTVTAMSTGEAVISATLGTDKAECTVTVGANGNIPSLQLCSALENNTATVDLKNQINLSCKVVFNSKEFTDISVEYTLSDPTIGTVEDGVFKPTKVGPTDVTITANWRGLSSAEYETMTQVLTVNVEEYKAIVLDGGELGEYMALELYSKSEHSGYTFKNAHTVDIAAVEGESEKACAVEIIEGEDVVAYDDATKTITGKAFGEAKIKFSFVASNQEEVSVVLPVIVSPPIVKYTETLRFSTYDQVFSNEEGKLTMKDIFGYETTLLSARQDGNDKIGVEDGKVKNLYIDDISQIATTTITILDAEVGYTIDLEVCAKFVYDKEDLRIFNFNDVVKDSDSATEGDQSVLRMVKGYVSLCADIVDTEFEGNTYYNYYTLARKWHPIARANASYKGKAGFQGTFEGNGHTLTIKTAGGLFNEILSGSVIRNVNFKDCEVVAVASQTNSLFGLAEGNLTVENVSISLSSNTYTSFTNTTTGSGENKRGWTMYVLPYYTSTKGAQTCKNVVFAYNYLYVTEGEVLPNRQVVFATYTDYYKGYGVSTDSENVYVLELNKDSETTYALPFVAGTKEDGTALTTYAGYDGLKDYFATKEGQRALATFDSNWNKEEGCPIWASSYTGLETITNLGKLMFSGWKDETEGFTTDTDGDNQVLPADLAVEGTVTGVYLKEKISSTADFTAENNLYVNGKVNLTNTEVRTVVYQDVIITTSANKNYLAVLEIYTRIINSKEDLRMFDFDTMTNTRLLNGYYVLGSDIVDSEETYNGTYLRNVWTAQTNAGTTTLDWGTWWGAIGYQGVFDGLGHTLTLKTTTGLFTANVKSGSVIRNVNFENCTVTAASLNSKNTLLGSVSQSGPVYLQNLSVSLSDATYTNFASDSAPNLYVLMYDGINAGANFIECKNVMVEVNYAKLPTAETTSTTKYLYVVSQLRTGTSNFNVVAINYDETKTYARSLVLLEDGTEVATASFDVTKYDSYVKLAEYFATEEGATALAKFDTTYWDVTNGYPVWKVESGSEE